MNTLDTQIVETALLTTADGNSKYYADLATLILNEMSVGEHGDLATDNPYHAMYKAALRNSLENDLAQEDAEKQGVKFKPAYYDIAHYSFVQQTMNSACWAIRKGATKRATMEEREAELDGGNGQDFAADYGDDIGLDTVSQETIESDVMEIYRRLFYTSQKIAAKLGMGRAEPLWLFTSSQQVNGEWETVAKTNSWNDALSCMDHISENRRNKSDGSGITTEDLNAPFDLGDRKPSPERLAELGDKFRANKAAQSVA